MEKNLDELINDAYISFLRKENELLHYYRYTQMMWVFEKYLEDNQLLEPALSHGHESLDLYLRTRNKLKEYGKDLSVFTKELIYKGYYQNFEEFLFLLFYSLYTSFPIFLKKDNEHANIPLDLLFASMSVNEIKNELIERKVKEVIQSNNIQNLLKKFKTTFGLELNLENDDKDFLVLASANRNILIHNNGIINSVYLNTLKKFKISTKYKAGDNLLNDIGEIEVDLRLKIQKISKKLYTQIKAQIKQVEEYHKNIS